MAELLKTENWFRIKTIRPATEKTKQIAYMSPFFVTKKAVTIEHAENKTMKMEQEMLLWQYIDGECSKEERAEVEQLLILDANVRDHYEEMMQMHRGFKQFFAQQPKKTRVRNINK